MASGEDAFEQKRLLQTKASLPYLDDASREPQTAVDGISSSDEATTELRWSV